MTNAEYYEKLERLAIFFVELYNVFGPVSEWTDSSRAKLYELAEELKDY